MNKLGRWLLSRLAGPDVKSAVLGDIEEIYAERLRDSGPARAKFWFWRQVLESAPFLIGDSRLRRHDRRGETPGHFSSAVRVAGMSVGLACCLTIGTITRWIQNDPSPSVSDASPAAVHETFGESPSGQPPVGLTPASSNGRRPAIDAADLSAPAATRGEGSLRRLDDRHLIGHAIRLFTLEFLIMLAGGLVFINSFPGRPSPRPLRTRFRATVIRSTTFVLLTGGLSFLFGVLLRPYFRLLIERRMILYWLVIFWLFLGGVFHLFPAIVLSFSTKKSRPAKARRLAALNLAFSLAFLLGTGLIFLELDRLKDAQAARGQIRTSARLPFDAEGGFESRLSR